MSAGTLAAFSALAFVIIVIPGPSVLFIVGRALQHGRRDALLSVVGNTGGALVHAILVAAGIGAVIAASSIAFVVLKFVGGGYLLYLGIQAVRHRREGLDFAAGKDGQAADAVVALPDRPLRRVLGESFAVGVTNPKTLVFVAAVLPQFVDPAAGPAWTQILALGALFAAIALVSDGAYALAASGARNWFARSPRRLARMRAAGGVMIGSLGVVLMASRRVA
ncbi:LysE family translocator [Demequina sp. TTPB684]|uniref:LysE family translocator n=1 Tax=unclassified Demequina TaxID=2620311 RepID=UPI001CF31E54|nr:MULTISPECIES: LysE family translocator [unclassified Demequina]MCB2413407.1 LysE family translocator [Demequina sp. TTPB684]UPU87970.1 LysE family translocator [Demequina sp. TMPB413]